MRRCASFSMKTKTVTPSSNTTNRHPCSDNSMMTLLLRSRAGSTTRWKARYGELWNSPPFDAPSDRRPSGATPHRNGPPEQERTRRHDGSQWLRTQTALIGLEDWRRAVLRCPRQRCDHSSENQIGRLIGAIACQVNEEAVNARTCVPNFAWRRQLDRGRGPSQSTRTPPAGDSSNKTAAPQRHSARAS